MAKYSGQITHDVGTATESLVFVETGATVRRLGVYDIAIGSNATPADQSARYSMYRATSGTPAGDAVTEFALNPDDVAATAAALQNLGTEPGTKTYASDWPQNQRATFRWVGAPGSQIWSAAAASSGIGVEIIATTGVHIPFGTIFWEE